MIPDSKQLRFFCQICGKHLRRKKGLIYCPECDKSKKEEKKIENARVNQTIVRKGTQ